MSKDFKSIFDDSPSEESQLIKQEQEATVNPQHQTKDSLSDKHISLLIGEDYPNKKNRIIYIDEHADPEKTQPLLSFYKDDEDAPLNGQIGLALNKSGDLEGFIYSDKINEVFNHIQDSKNALVDKGELIADIVNSTMSNASLFIRAYQKNPEIYDFFYKEEYTKEALKFIDSLSEKDYQTLAVDSTFIQKIKKSSDKNKLILFLDIFDGPTDERLPKFFKSVISDRQENPLSIVKAPVSTPLVINAITGDKIKVPKGLVAKQAFDLEGSLISQNKEYKKVQTSKKNKSYYALAFIDFNAAIEKGLLEAEITTNPLYGYAERVHAAVYTLFIEGNEYQSVDMIYNKMCLTNGLNCPKKQENLINECMELMRFTDTSVISEKENSDALSTGRKPRPLEGSLIPWERIKDVSVNGNLTTVYHIFRCPPLAEYEGNAGRIMTITTEDLNIPNVKIYKIKDEKTGKTTRKATPTKTKDINVVPLLANTLENGEIKYIVLAKVDMLIQTTKNNKDFNNLLVYDKIYDTLQVKNSGLSDSRLANKKKKIADIVLMVLENQVRLGKIHSYEETSNGRIQRYGVKINLSKPKKSS